VRLRKTKHAPVQSNKGRRVRRYARSNKAVQSMLVRRHSRYTPLAISGMVKTELYMIWRTGSAAGGNRGIADQARVGHQATPMTDPVEPIRSPVLAVPHAFFTRTGGVSSGTFATLNCSLSSNDSPNAILKNRARAARALGLAPDRLVGVNQVHGTRVVEVTAPWAPGGGPPADAMVCRRPRIGLGIITADCAPVLFADAGIGVVGAAHAGWRGAVGGILEATLQAMQRLGARKSRVIAAIGPCIAQASYEVGPDLREAVVGRGAVYERFFAPGRRPDRWQFDLAGFCTARLQAAGVAVIDRIEADTMTNEARFFSHRRRTLSGGGPIGHQISIICAGLAAKC